VAVEGLSQGSLTPSGAPSLSMKTLAQVEPRSPISTPGAVISQPGSYYLTTNLLAAGHGVEIKSDNVTLDLNGFAIVGASNAGTNGIFISGDWSSGYKAITVRNGHIRGFKRGVHAQNVSLCRFEDLVASTNQYGFYLYAAMGRCNGNRFERCAAADCTAVGFYLTSASAGQCCGNALLRCSATACAGAGFLVYPQSASQCDANLIASCTSENNGGGGIALECSASQCDGNAVVGCTIGKHRSSGIYLNGQNGKVDGNRVADCVVRANASHGIRCYRADGNRIEGNVVSETTGTPGFGIVTETGSVSNLVLRNVCTANSGGGVSVAVGDTFGPAVSAAGEMATSGDGAHPWANVVR
jgi:parallel beta-helix repeat protein